MFTTYILITIIKITIIKYEQILRYFQDHKILKLSMKFYT